MIEALVFTWTSHAEKLSKLATLTVTLKVLPNERESKCPGLVYSTFGLTALTSWGSVASAEHIMSDAKKRGVFFCVGVLPC